MEFMLEIGGKQLTSQVLSTLSLVEIRSFDRNTFRQTFSWFGHVIRSYFGYAYKIQHQIECRLLYCIKFYIISVSIPFGKHSANIQPFRSCESVKVQLGLKFGKKITVNLTNLATTPHVNSRQHFWILFKLGKKVQILK